MESERVGERGGEIRSARVWEWRERGGRSGSARVWEWGERGVKVERDGKRERGVKWGESEEREWEGSGKGEIEMG